MAEKEEEPASQTTSNGTAPTKKKKKKGLLKGGASRLAKATSKGVKAVAGSAGAVYQASKDGVQTLTRKSPSSKSDSNISDAADQQGTTPSNNNNKALESAGRGVQKLYQAGVDGAGAIVKGADTVVAQPLRKSAEAMAKAAAKTRGKKGDASSDGNQADTTDATEDNNASVPALPPDKALQDMDILLSKRLTNVSVEDYYQATWLSKSFCQERLDHQGSFDTEIGDWQDDGEGAAPNEHEGETYDHIRLVDFQFNVSTPLPGPSVAGVNERQFGRIQANDRCVVNIVVQTSSVPFCDTFHVNQRWVATRVGEKDLLLQVGVFVVFRKSCFVAGKIRSATKQESFKSLLAHYELMKSACGAQEGEVEAAGGVVLAEEEVAANPLDLLVKKSSALFATCFPFLSAPAKDDLDDVDQELVAIGDKLKTVKELPASVSPDGREEQVRLVEASFGTISHAMNTILLDMLGSDTPAAKAAKQSGKADEEAKTGDGPTERKSLSVVVTPLKHLSIKGKLLPKSFGSLFKYSTSANNKQQSGPGDDPLSSMNIVLDKKMNNVCASDFYNQVLGDDVDFYKAFLEKSGKSNVRIGKWEQSSPGGALFVDSWDGEEYQKKRDVEFQYKRQTFLGYGTQSVHVSGVQYFRFSKDKNQFILTSAYSLSKGVFSKAFQSHLRYVGADSKEGDMMELRAGIFVVILSNTLLAGKIRAGAIQEAAKHTKGLYKACQEHITGVSSSKRSSVDDSELVLDASDFESSTTNSPPLPCNFCAPKPQLGTMIADDEQLSQQLKVIEKKFVAIKAVLGEDFDREQIEAINTCLGQLEVIAETLNDIIESNTTGS